MRNASELAQRDGKPVRATFEVPRPLYVEFCAAARARDQTFSQEMRRFMREYIDPERTAA